MVTVTDWLLDSDPAIRWQVMRDLTHEPPEVYEAERARVPLEGWGARLLAEQGADGDWAGGSYQPKWKATTWSLLLLRSCGINPSAAPVKRAVESVRDQSTWEWNDGPFFKGEIEPCINGEAVAIGAYFGQDVSGIVSLLLTQQMPDGGWNCDVPLGSVVSSFHTTICVLEGLLEFERSGDHPGVREARLRGEEYLLERHLYRRLSTGEVANPKFLNFAFPTRWHYDVLRGLEYFRAADPTPDERCAEAIELVESKRDSDGRWALDINYRGETFFELDEGEGRASKWNTLRALRVLDWFHQG